jgi:hypothetical protein
VAFLIRHVCEHETNGKDCYQSSYADCGLKDLVIFHNKKIVGEELEYIEIERSKGGSTLWGMCWGRRTWVIGMRCCSADQMLDLLLRCVQSYNLLFLTFHLENRQNPRYDHHLSK